MRQSHYHFIGIGGIGMSALAHILLSRGQRVTGSDRNETPITRELKRRGAHIFYKHDAAHIKPSQIVVYSTAIRENNPEFARARELGCLMWHRSDLLRCLSQKSQEIVVAGAHGKTTTSTTLAHVLRCGGLDPSYVVGGRSHSLPQHGYQGKGDYFVLEGDESDGSFLKSSPHGAILTNIEEDHLDFWGSRDALYHAYINFLLKVKNKNLLLWCADDPFLRALNLDGVGYGFSKRAPLRASNLRELTRGSVFDILYEDTLYPNVTLPLLGKHNVLNALAVYGMARKLGVSDEQIRQGFNLFKGVCRRLEIKGERDGVTFIDDYAHHPSEIEATLGAMEPVAKDRRLFVVFQPHRYSRLSALKEAFLGAFKKADRLIVTDVFAAGENPIEGLSGDCLVSEIPREQGQTCEYVARDRIEDFLTQSVQSQDIVLTLGAGDITHVATALST